MALKDAERRPLDPGQVRDLETTELREELGRLEEARSAWQKGAEAPKGRRGWRRSSQQNTHRQLCSMALVMTK